MSTIIATLRYRLQVAVLAALITFAYAALPHGLYDGIEHFFYDALVSFSPPIEAEARVIIVDIDEASLAKYGPWPWSRKRMSELVRALTERHKVGLLGIDIVFPEKKSGDKSFSKALDQPAVILSQALDFSPDSANRVGTLSDTFALPESVHLLPAASGYIGNHPGLITPGASVGHISPVLDQDGKVRRLYPLACMDAVCTQALSLRMFTRLTDVSPDNLTVVRRQGVPALRIASGHHQTLDLPLDSQGALIIPWHVKPAGFLTLSAAQVMNTKTPLPALENSIVLLGSTALGIGDRIATPLGKLMPGIEVHAQLLIALLDRRLIKSMPARSMVFLMLVALVLVSFLVWPFRSRHMGRGLLWPVLMLSATAILFSWLLLRQGILMPLSPLPLLIVSLFILLIAQQNQTLANRMGTLGTQFSQFLPSTLVARLLKNRPIGPETELHTMTVLIVDVRGFTSASEGKTPAQVAEFAQRCFEVFAAEVARYHGTIEKYTGDGLMALWGVPTEGDKPGVSKNLPDAPLYVHVADPMPDLAGAHTHAPYAVQAVSAAIAMQKAADALAPWFTERGYARLQLSIGLNTGPMSVGVFGGHSHMAWSAQGQAFNIASRIEQLTRIAGRNLLIGEATARLIDQKYFYRVGDYRVNGMSTPLAVYGLAESIGQDRSVDINPTSDSNKKTIKAINN